MNQPFPGASGSHILGRTSNISSSRARALACRDTYDLLLVRAKNALFAQNDPIVQRVKDARIGPQTVLLDTRIAFSYEVGVDSANGYINSRSKT